MKRVLGFAAIVFVGGCRGTQSAGDTGTPDTFTADTSDVASDTMDSSIDTALDAPPDVVDIDSPDTADEPFVFDGFGEGSLGPVLSPDPIPDTRVTCGPRSATPSVTAGAADRFLLRGRIVTPDTVFAPGEVVIAGGVFTCVATSCASDPNAAGATVIETGGVIYPGLVSAHDHTAYDWLPPWPPPHLFGDRYQWEATSDYMAFVGPYRDNVSAHECAMTKYGEARAIVGGSTSNEGAPDRLCIHNLARNVEYGWDFAGVDTVRTNVLGISTVTGTSLTTLQGELADDSVTAYIIHLAEGIDESSRAEFDSLETKLLLTPSTVVIHGTGATPVEAMAMGGAGAKLVWSPRSNAILYGHTTDIPAMLAAGVVVALGPDWTLSGGPNQLSELRYARYVVETLWPGLLTSHDLVDMVTTRAAIAVSRQASIGSIAVGMVADLLVVPDTGCDPYDTLIDAPTADVAMVFVRGAPIYGDAALMTALPAADLANCEAVSFCGVDKQICVSEGPGAANGDDQTLADITAEIETFYPTPYPLVPLCP